MTYVFGSLFSRSTKSTATTTAGHPVTPSCRACSICHNRRECSLLSVHLCVHTASAFATMQRNWPAWVHSSKWTYVFHNLLRDLLSEPHKPPSWRTIYTKWSRCSFHNTDRESHCEELVLLFLIACSSYYLNASLSDDTINPRCSAKRIVLAFAARRLIPRWRYDVSAE